MLPAKAAFLEFEFEIFLNGATGRVLKQTIFADVMSTWKKDDRVMVRRDHKFEAYAANIGLDLMTDFFVELLGLLLTALCQWVVNLLNEVGRIVFNAILNV